MRVTSIVIRYSTRRSFGSVIQFVWSSEMKKGRPPVKDKAKFKTVAVPIDAYNLLRVAAEREHRSIARQLAFMVEQQESRAS